MEIEVLSNSLTSDIREYLQTRILQPRIIALWALILIGVWSCWFPQETERLAWRAAIDVAFSGLLLTSFRLWDDLADAEHDAVVDPDRTLCLTSHRGSFNHLRDLLVVANVLIAAATRNVSQVGILVALTCLMIVWYSGLPRYRWPVVNYHIVLLKYPFFIFVLAPSAVSLVTSSSVSTAVTIYLLLSVYEVYDDSTLRRRRSVCWLAGVELVILLSILSTAVASVGANCL